MFETARPFDTPRLMGELVDWYDAATETNALHPLLAIGIFTIVFLKIHPFQDGNGRFSRVLTTLLLLRAGYAYVPYSSQESVIEQSKEGYYLALRRTQRTIRTGTPDWEPWLEFFLRALQRQMQQLRVRVEREKLMMGEISELQARIIELARTQGRVTMRDAAALTGVSRNTLKVHLRELVRGGRLVLNKAGRGVWYSLR